jgi:glucose/arabinose dehydrogenase
VKPWSRPASVLLVAALPALLSCRSGPAARATDPGRSDHSLPLHEPDRPYTIRNAFRQLRFQNPVFAVMPPGAPGRWFIGEREGRILAVENREDAERAELVLDLRAHTLGWQDSGLLNLAFHPEFGRSGSPNRGYFYVWYNHTDQPPRGPEQPYLGARSSNRLSRFSLPDGARAADPASELVLIEQRRHNTDHQGGGLFFHPEDGFLYLAVGDGGHPLTESRGYFWMGVTDDAQRIDRDLLSGLLRIDVDRRGAGVSHPIRRQPRNGRTQGYFIPDDNPWVAADGSVLEEFYAIGLRNPHRASYDPQTRRIFVGDVGDRRIEEVDVIERGGNYQWSYLEGGDPTRHRRPERPLGVQRGPLHIFTHRTSGSVIGGFVYRGSQFPELAGRYLFGDNGSGQIWSLPGQATAPAAVDPLLRLPMGMTVYAGLSSFAHDDRGEPYFCVLGDNDRGTGTLQKLVRAPRAERPAPATLSATGLFADTAALVPQAGLFPYQVNAAFWSDHADKTRWLYLPPGTRIGFQPEDSWKLPAGTVAVKHFDLAIDERDPGQRRRLETRVLVLDRSGGAYGRTYKWRPDGRDADLLAAPVTERLTATSKQPWGELRAAPLGGRGRGQVQEQLQEQLIDGGGPLELESPAGGTLFAHLTETADFDLAASFGPVDGGTAGLMVRDGLLEQAAYVFVGREGDRLRLEVRPRAGAAVEVSHAGGQGGDESWIRLRRAGGSLVVFVGRDGHLWREVRQLDAGEGLDRVGLAARAGGTGKAQARVLSTVRCLLRDHLYPGDGDCVACHTSAAGFVLGTSTRQWNRPVRANGVEVNQLVLASERGLLDRVVNPSETGVWKRLADLHDASASVETRVRSYLDVNCGQCHRPGLVAQVPFDARFDTPLERQALVDAPVRWPNVTHVADRMIYPRSPERSRVFAFMSRQLMPPIGNLLAHDQALDLLRRWIQELPGPPALASVAIRRAKNQVTLTHPDPEAAIHYTVDGTGPGPDTPRYRGPFQAPAGVTVRAAAFRTGFVPSKLASLELRD